MRKELFENFYSKIKFNELTWCWEWLGSVTNNGYGQFTFLNKTYKSHRMSYMLFKGFIPNDEEIDHLCHNKICCNPDHLKSVSRSENLSNRNEYRHGTSYKLKSGNNIEDKIFLNIIINNECWEWLGKLDNDGYGRVTFNNDTYRSHRFSYLLFKGEILDNNVIDHICGNRKCCNPDHLEAVTHNENMNRGNTGKINNHQSKKNYCPKGHEYTPENTYLNPKGSRECRICKVANRKTDRARNLEKYRELDRNRWLNRHNT